MQMASSNRLNPQALACEEAQSAIRLAVKNATLKRRPKAELDKAVRVIISKCIERLTSQELKSAAYRSLVQFYNKERQIVSELLTTQRLILFLALTTLVGHRATRKEDKSEYA